MGDAAQRAALLRESVTRLPIFNGDGTDALTPEQFPQSQRVYERMVSLPLYTRMGVAEVDRVVAAVRQALT